MSDDVKKATPEIRTALELAQMILRVEDWGAWADVREAARAIVERDARQHTEAQRQTEERRKDERTRSEITRARRVAIETWKPVIGKKVRDAGRHLRGNGYRWGLALTEAGMPHRGVSYSGSHTASIVEDVVAWFLGIYRYDGNGGYNPPKDPDMVALETFCAKLRKTKNASGRNADQEEEWRKKGGGAG